MTRRFIMTAFAKDRLGLVADITKIIFDNDCNLEDTEMTQLVDEFVIMLLFTGQKQGLPEQVTKECRRLEKEKNISAFVRELEGEITKPIKNFTTYSLHVQGVDQAGMVYKISDFLYKNSINISKLLSRQTMSPQSGTTIYTIEMEIQVPKEKSPDELEHDFSELGNQMQIDFHIDGT